jgi:hypothetical protein
VLRVGWKPDISTMAAGPNSILADYANQFASSMIEKDLAIDIRRMAGVLDLITHDNPALTILELGIQDDKTTEHFLDIIDANIQLKRFQSYTQGSISKEGEIVGRRVRSALDLTDENQSGYLEDGTLYDLIVLSLVSRTALK